MKFERKCSLLARKKFDSFYVSNNVVETDDKTIKICTLEFDSPVFNSFSTPCVEITKYESKKLSNTTYSISANIVVSPNDIENVINEIDTYKNKYNCKHEVHDYTKIEFIKPSFNIHMSRDADEKVFNKPLNEILDTLSKAQVKIKKE